MQIVEEPQENVFPRRVRTSGMPLMRIQVVLMRVLGFEDEFEMHSICKQRMRKC